MCCSELGLIAVLTRGWLIALAGGTRRSSSSRISKSRRCAALPLLSIPARPHSCKAEIRRALCWCVPPLTCVVVCVGGEQLIVTSEHDSVSTLPPLNDAGQRCIGFGSRPSQKQTRSVREEGGKRRGIRPRSARPKATDDSGRAEGMESAGRGMLGRAGVVMLAWDGE
eukprot:2250966-Rhodomonas_salina.2